MAMGKRAVAVFAFVLCLFGVYAACHYFGFTDTTESRKTKTAVSQCIFRGEEILAQINVVPVEILEKYAGGDDSAIMVLQETDSPEPAPQQKADLALYFCDDVVALYGERNESNLSRYLEFCRNPDGQEPFPMVVDSGIFDFELKKLEVTGDIAEAVVTFSSRQLLLDRRQIKQARNIT